MPGNFCDAAADFDQWRAKSSCACVLAVEEESCLVEMLAIWLKYGFLIILIGEFWLIGLRLVQLARTRAHPDVPDELQVEE
jgi:hypothetical protein